MVLCNSLSLAGIPSGCYHAGMKLADRTESHMNWINNTIQVLYTALF